MKLLKCPACGGPIDPPTGQSSIPALRYAKGMTIDLAATHEELVRIEEEIRKAKDLHNGFLEELGLPPLP